MSAARLALRPRDRESGHARRSGGSGWSGWSRHRYETDGIVAVAALRRSRRTWRTGLAVAARRSVLAPVALLPFVLESEGIIVNTASGVGGWPFWKNDCGCDGVPFRHGQHWGIQSRINCKVTYFTAT